MAVAAAVGGGELLWLGAGAITAGWLASPAGQNAMTSTAKALSNIGSRSKAEAKSETCQECKKKCPSRSVDSITMKRKHINLTADDRYGHWWMELGPNESYGWWPAHPVGLKETLTGTDGALNGGDAFGGSPTMDPHHGDPADETFHPKTKDGDCRSDEEIKACLRAFAQSYSGSWRWTFGAGQNCHTFQEAAMAHCGLSQ